MVHEPLNERFGVVGVPVAYPFVDVKGGQYAPLLDEITSFRRPWNRDPEFLPITGMRRKLYALSGGRSGLRWSQLKLRERLRIAPRHVCLKDPFASLATPYLINRIGARVVCMVRHPAAIHFSTEKQGWWFDVENLFNQAELIARYGGDIPESHWALARKYHAASIALLWKFMLRVNEPLREEDGRSLMLRHEDLCLEPTQAAHKIFEHLDVPYTSRVEFNTFWSGRCSADRIFLKQIYEPDLRKLEGLLELDISSLSRHW